MRMMKTKTTTWPWLLPTVQRSGMTGVAEPLLEFEIELIFEKYFYLIFPPGRLEFRHFHDFYRT